MLIDFIAGSKADYYKLVPLVDAVQKEQDAGRDLGYRFVFTGTTQDLAEIHDEFSIPGLPSPNIILESVSETPAIHAANTLTRYEEVLSVAKPDIAMICGHSNGGMAAALAAAKAPDVRIAHLGSGMRNFIRNSIEEVNRKVIDSVTDYHFPMAQSSGENLRNEGVADDFIFFVGNPVSDLLSNEQYRLPKPLISETLHLKEKKYLLLTLEHAALTSSSSRLKSLLLHLIRVSRNMPIILPVNPQSAHTLSALGIKAHNLHITERVTIPHLYYLARNARAVITDNELLQDETTIMQVPCLTLLKSVAMPDTYTIGSNEITGIQQENIAEAMHKLFAGEWKKGKIPYLWDGKVSSRIISVLQRLT